MKSAKKSGMSFFYIKTFFLKNRPSHFFSVEFHRKSQYFVSLCRTLVKLKVKKLFFLNSAIQAKISELTFKNFCSVFLHADNLVLRTLSQNNLKKIVFIFKN